VRTTRAVARIVSPPEAAAADGGPIGGVADHGAQVPHPTWIPGGGEEPTRIRQRGAADRPSSASGFGGFWEERGRNREPGGEDETTGLAHFNGQRRKLLPFCVFALWPLEVCGVFCFSLLEEEVPCELRKRSRPRCSFHVSEHGFAASASASAVGLLPAA